MLLPFIFCYFYLDIFQTLLICWYHIHFVMIKLGFIILGESHYNIILINSIILYVVIMLIFDNCYYLFFIIEIYAFDYLHISTRDYFSYS